MHARQRERGRDVDRLRGGAGHRAAEDRGVQQARQADVAGVASLAPGPLEPVLTRRGPADDLERAGGPLVERVLLDDRPDLLVAALDLLLGPDQSRHVAIASSMLE